MLLRWSMKSLLVLDLLILNLILFEGQRRVMTRFSFCLSLYEISFVVLLSSCMYWLCMAEDHVRFHT